MCSQDFYSQYRPTLAHAAQSLVAASILLLFSVSTAAQETIFSNGFETGDLTAWSPDLVAPKIFGPSPADGSLLNIGAATVSVRIADWGTYASQLDPASLRLVVDGIDRTDDTGFGNEIFHWRTESLADGVHTVQVTAADFAGNTETLVWDFTVDTVPPTATLDGPTDITLRSGERPSVGVSVVDSGSGIATVPVRALWDGEALPCTVSSVAGQFACRGVAATVDRTIQVEFVVEDLAGNAQTVGPFTVNLRVDSAPPTLSFDAPFPGAWVRSPFLVSGTVGDDLGIDWVEVGDSNAEIDGATWSADLELEDGTHGLLATAVDLQGRRTSVELEVHVDTVPPVLEILSPASGSTVNGNTVQVVGFAEDLRTPVTVTVGGEPVSVDGLGEFHASVSVAEPLNDTTKAQVVVVVTDQAGNQVSETLDLDYWSLPEVAITSPLDLSTLAATSIDVEGTVSGGADVSVNGVTASVNGSTFLATGVPLAEGGTLITAVATDRAGHQSTDTINVVRDLTPPRLSIYRPLDGSTVFRSPITVAGLVNDLVPGTVHSESVSVTVDGLPAAVANRSFAAQVPLEPGIQEIQVEAVDASGNTVSESLLIELATPSGAHLEFVSGDGQSAAVDTLLPQPLTVRAVDDLGQPVAGLAVIFSVEQGDGSLDGGRRRIAVMTDGSGEARTTFRLGRRAGVHNHVVSAQASGYGLPINFSASAAVGPASAVLADAGVLQTGVAGLPLPRPLVATVTDAGHNRLPGIPVIFRVEQGAGSFTADDSTEIVVPTDADGRAMVEVRLDPAAGVARTVVAAHVDGVDSVATFVGSGLSAGDSSATAITGVVLDNSGEAIPGVTVYIRGSALSTTTDSAGFFHLVPAPVGTVFLEVDGSTADRPGTWPHLEYVVTTVPGNTVDVGMPIHLLPLDLASGVFVDETTGATLELPDIPGFRMEIAPGSATFPGGGSSGTVSVTAVHYDRIPMTPGFGQQPRLIVTVQPAGAVFDPPAHLTLPNVENLAPGSVTEMYSFDHDLGHFVSIGPASVSADGSVIVADPGVGIVKAGWHCGGNPVSAGTPHACPTCQNCDGRKCVASCPVGFGEPNALGCSSGSCQDTMCEKRSCLGGRCRATPREVESITVTIDGDDPSTGIVLPTGKSVSFVAEIEHDCEDLAVRWLIQPAVPDADVTAPSFSATVETPGNYRGLIRAQCRECPGSSMTERFAFTAFEIQGVESEGDSLQPVGKGSAGEDVQPFVASREDGAEGGLRAIIEPSVEPSKLMGKISWNGASASAGDPTRATVSLASADKVEASVDASGTDGRHRQEAWVYVVDVNPSDFSPSGGTTGSSFRDYPCGFWNTAGCGYDYDEAWYRLSLAGGHLETGWVPPSVTGNNKMSVGTRAEFQFQLEPMALVDDYAAGLIQKPPIEFNLHQEERSCFYSRRGDGEWTFVEANSNLDWFGDDCCSPSDDVDPWDGQGLMHGRDSPSSDGLQSDTTGYFYKLNLRTWIDCGLGVQGGDNPMNNRCGDYHLWHSFIWVERDLESGEITAPGGSNEVAEGNAFWGAVPVANGCQPQP